MISKIGSKQNVQRESEDELVCLPNQLLKDVMRQNQKYGMLLCIDNLEIANLILHICHVNMANTHHTRDMPDTTDLSIIYTKNAVNTNHTMMQSTYKMSVHKYFQHEMYMYKNPVSCHIFKYISFA